jgi:methyl-accepting chemotaxis protein
MGQRTAGRRRASSRVGRVGPGSLGARLLTVLLVPIIGLQVFAFREVQGHNRSAASAAQVSARVALLQYSGQLIVPLYVELTATDGIAQGEQLGLSRNVLTEAVGLNFIDMINTARAQLDESLDGLATAWPDERLPSGVTLGEEVAEIRLDLARVRAQFDAAEQRASDVTAVFARIVALVDQINSQSSTIFEQSATTRELAGIGAETEEFLQLLEYATTELRFVTEAGISAGDNDQIYGAIVTSGSFQSSLDRLRSLLEPQRREAFDTMVSGDAFERMDAALPTWVSTLVGLGQQDATVLDDPVAVELMVDTVVASFDRLTDLQSYGMTFLPEEVQRAEAIQASAERSRHDAMVVMIAAVAASLVLLGLVLISILRPLRRLARQSQLVVDGDLALAPLRPTGPTDIRVVMRTFNEMVTTLRAYDAQVRKLALGEMQIDRTLPGPLGDTLRQSVSHLATVTSKLHASEAAANVQARTDSLTGLANRTAALEHLPPCRCRHASSGTLSAIVFLDLDGFKSVNDTQGHGEGDRILGEIGAGSRPPAPTTSWPASVATSSSCSSTGSSRIEVTELARYLHRHRVGAVHRHHRPDVHHLGIGRRGDGRRAQRPARLHRPGRLGGVPREGDAAAAESRCTTHASPATSRTAPTWRSPCARASRQPVQPAPAADHRHRHQGARRRRGAAALEPPRHRRGRAQRLHPDRRTHGRHPRSRRVGARAVRRHPARVAATTRSLRTCAWRSTSPAATSSTDRSAHCSPGCASEPGRPVSCSTWRSPRPTSWPTSPAPARWSTTSAAGHQGGHRRLRHRLLVDELPAPAHGRHAEDRPGVRGRHVRQAISTAPSSSCCCASATRWG